MADLDFAFNGSENAVPLKEVVTVGEHKCAI